MWKCISLILIVFLTTASCANTDTTNTPSPSATDEIISTPSLGNHFPQTTQLGSMEMFVSGELILDNGCLRVSESNPSSEYSYLLIWHSKFSTRTEQGIVHVIDASTGEVLASVGDYVEIDGGVIVHTTDFEWALKEPIPNKCSEPYWVVGESVKKIDGP